MISLTDNQKDLKRSLCEIRDFLRLATHEEENEAVATLLAASGLSAELRQKIVDDARTLVKLSRAQSDQQGSMDYFLQEFGLSNPEGVALMCLAEALLRVPDGTTADRLISEKILSGDWNAHKGQSDSLFVNASTWGLMLTGEIISLGKSVTKNPDSWMKKLVNKSGEPIIRAAVMQAMRIMGGQYVLGRTIGEAAKRGKKENSKDTRFSFDMLGEGARTLEDADTYFDAYARAIEKIGVDKGKHGVEEAPGISVKFSALHPRYEFAQHATVMKHMLPRIRTLALSAKEHGMGFTIDAEEADRLELSLDIFEALARDEALAGWDGLGLVVQAYQKRAPLVVDWLVRLAHDSGRKFMVRLVKGAYWDSEIKHAQEQGLPDYPVYTRKPSTDLSYQICAERLMAARHVIYPQFASHNAYTVALVLALAGEDRNFEFQRLHGMGHLLYNELQKSLEKKVHIRVYAPVGAHEDLLPYLVRRLLENGANSSFVNRFMDQSVPVEELMQDTVSLVEAAPTYRHGKIALPVDILSMSGLEGAARKNAKGFDLSDPKEVEIIMDKMQQTAKTPLRAGPIIGGERLVREEHAVISPANNLQTVGFVSEPEVADMDQALDLAKGAQKNWDQLGGNGRAKILENAADIMEGEAERLMGIIAREAGRTIADSLSEVREAVDFCRYYALQAKTHFAEPLTMPGPTGEENNLSLHGRGTFLCISPWNFPLAIFVGQVVAALAAGNAVMAKPAEQTPLIAAEAVKILHQAGVPVDALHLLPGDGARIGGKLVSDPRINGVAFTGSTDTARIINRALADREGAIIPLIAETGGQNVMIVDSSALPEQVVDDVISSAFQSAGQRCSALRLLYLQEEVAHKITHMLKGAMESLVIGDPMQLSTDVGPVIDQAACDMLTKHGERMDKEAVLIKALDVPEKLCGGSFFGPRIYQIESLKQLEKEVFGPILHVIRYKSSEMPQILADIKASGFGLTLGLHSRIEEKASEIFQALDVGNTYVNRNIVGAVVGVQPFGGQGLSGTGPKAGGPRYLFRFATEKTLTINTVATGGNTELFSLDD